MTRQAVEQREQEFQVAFNDGDAAAVTQFYGENGRILPPGGDPVCGHDEIEAFFKGFAAMRATVAFDLLTVYEAPDLCVAVGAFTMDLHPEGSPPQINEGKYIEVWTRRPDGGWLLVDDIFNSSLPG